MDFRDRLRTIFVGSGGQWRRFDRLTFRNGFVLSIQTVQGNYSAPGELLTPFEYSAFEVAVINPETDEIIGTVLGDVPVESVQKMYEQMVDGTFDVETFQETGNH
jgi:hypothetical protein